MRPVNVFLIVVLLSAIAAPGRGAEQTSGDWSANLTNDSSAAYAVTINDSGSLLGEYCSTDTGICVWKLAIDVSCEAEQKIAVLANSTQGADLLSILCDGKLADTKLYKYSFGDWKSLEKLMQDTDRIAFAVALKSTLFNVVRFSLSGRTQMTAIAEAAANKLAKGGTSAQGGSTRNTTL